MLCRSVEVRAPIPLGMSHFMPHRRQCVSDVSRIKFLSVKCTVYHAMSCSIECIHAATRACDEEEPWMAITSVIVASSVIASLVLTYMLKSRCTQIRCACLRIDRNPVELESKDATVSVQELA